MAKYRDRLPQLADGLFIMSGGLETFLTFKKGISLPCFAAFYVMKDPLGCEWIKDYLSAFVAVAEKYNVGIILQSPTWRASPDWIQKMDYPDKDPTEVNRQAVALIEDIRTEHGTSPSAIIINGSIGPRGDGYTPTAIMSPDEAQAYHAVQIRALSKTTADFITAFTLTYPEEAIGIVRAAKDASMPVAISFTVDSDGRLPTGQTLKEAIELVDNATDKSPIYYMINCAHPSTFEHCLNPDEAWVQRIHGFKGNASKKSHAELDDSIELDEGNPMEFGQCNLRLINKLKNVNILGGCCGTDMRHIEETCKACSGATPSTEMY